MGWMTDPAVEPDQAAPKSPGSGGQWVPLDPAVKGVPAAKPAEPWWDTASAGMVVLSPVALMAAFLLMRAIAIRSRPLAGREAARRALGVLPRLLIVLSCFWSCLLLGLVAWVAAHGEQVYPTWQTLVVTIAPVVGMWVIYFSARWIRQGAA